MFYMQHKGRGKAAKVVNFVAKWLNLCPTTVLRKRVYLVLIVDRKNSDPCIEEVLAGNMSLSPTQHFFCAVGHRDKQCMKRKV